MEIALIDEIPTFSGGLGVLAGDLLRGASDLGLPTVGVTLLYHEGFLHQEIDMAGRQVEHPVQWTPGDHMERLDARVTVTIADRPVVVGVWQRVLIGVDGFQVPVYFLDTLLPENDPIDQAITSRLYTGIAVERLSQEVVLGMAGPAMLRELGHKEIDVYHLNEGHASLVPIALLLERRKGKLASASPSDIKAIRDRCVFTTHTPIAAGHDRFEPLVLDHVLGSELANGLRDLDCLENGTLDMTVLGMFFSRFINGVSQRHGRVSQAMFPRYRVAAITNGVHVPTWTAPSTARLFDKHLSGWRHDNTVLRYATGIPLEEIRAAQAEAKQVLLNEVLRRQGVTLDPEVLTIGVARRATPYKRNDLLLSRPEELRALVERVGPLQIVYSGKAHPLDEPGKVLIERVNAAAAELAGDISVIYLEDYGLRLARLLVAGVDVWLNTPVPPHEACGTSGMKAALNGVPSLSTLDGWWLEGYIAGVTGWAIDVDRADLPIGDPVIDAADRTELYRVLAEAVAPLYYRLPDDFATIRRFAIAMNGSFFTAQRMVTEYEAKAYRQSDRLHR
jgi:glycogen phosphorylase